MLQQDVAENCRQQNTSRELTARSLGSPLTCISSQSRCTLCSENSVPALNSPIVLTSPLMRLFMTRAQKNQMPRMAGRP